MLPAPEAATEGANPPVGRLARLNYGENSRVTSKRTDRQPYYGSDCACGAPAEQPRQQPRRTDTYESNYEPPYQGQSLEAKISPMPLLLAKTRQSS